MNLAVAAPGLLSGALGVVGLYGATIIGAASYRRPKVWARWRFKGVLARRLDRLDLFRDRCGIYVHLWGPLPLYIGQTIDADDRMRSHGKDIRTQFYTHCLFFAAPAGELNDLEKRLHRLMPWTQALGFNRTGGGS